MKRLFSVIAMVLALNFVVVVGLVGWLVKTGKLDRQRFEAIKAIVFPKPAEVLPQENGGPTTQPVMSLDALLAELSGRRPEDQLAYFREALDKTMAELEERQTELIALRDAADKAKANAQREREAFEQARKQFEARQAAVEKQANDKGFQDALAIYKNLPAKQSKDLFMGADVDTTVQYFQAMDSSAVSRITKEFKTPAERARLKAIVDRMHKPNEATRTLPAPVSAAGNP